MDRNTFTPEQIIEASEALIHRRPIIVRRQVRWGDCDPAQVVYTPRFAEYAVAAAAFFFDDVFGKAFIARRADKSFGYPLRALSFEFEKSLTPHELFDMRVEVSAIRSRTFELTITGLRLDGEVAFRCLFVPICIAVDERRALPLPAEVRTALEEYMAECTTA
ncbi:hypothetical protein PMI36_05299 [Pseudomonas sp. GM79]|uniref:acyl-CoA thioesterase n=1 Tax=Pseudomonas sp. GM79 TaxID=1144338 RepID=UPI00026FCA9F|nr:thioesterase family protein [Pseudomonas sp. GM79]EJN17882.1 hypothetical protein PMI36_05299 [Pseudomonas sp. GM79]